MYAGLWCSLIERRASRWTLYAPQPRSTMTEMAVETARMTSAAESRRVSSQKLRTMIWGKLIRTCIY
jgi:hypothetical protein